MSYGVAWGSQRAQNLSEVILLLINLVFGIPSLQWGPQHELDHLELFAGESAVSKAEFKDGFCVLWDIPRTQDSQGLSPTHFTCYLQNL